MKNGISFLELMISVLILGLIFLYVIPVFITSTRYSYQQKESLKASLFSQALMEKLREESRLYIPPCNPSPCSQLLCSTCLTNTDDVFSNLQYLYSTSNPYTYASFFQNNHFNPQKSYIIAYPETENALSSASASKKLVIHLAWNIPSSGKTENYDLITRFAMPSGWFPLNPNVLPCTYPTSTTTSSTSTSTTSTSSTSTSSTSSTSTSSTSTSSTSTSSTSSTSTSSTSTSSTSTTTFVGGR